MKKEYTPPQCVLLPLPEIATLSLSDPDGSPSLPFVPFNAGTEDDYF